MFKNYERSKEISMQERVEKRIRNKQWSFRSKKREELHIKTFKCKPIDLQNLPEINTTKEIQKIIQKLASKNAAINKEVYHWTTFCNFIKMIDKEYIFGNEILKSHKIIFQENTLGEKDVENGDLKTICFCHFFVDSGALIKSNRIKDGLIRLTIDLNKVECGGQYNQFFKLCDFESPSFEYLVKITDRLTVTFKKNYECKESCERSFKFEVIIKLDSNEEMAINVDKEEAIFYGDLYGINIFCLTRLFYFIEKIEDTKFKGLLKNYLFSVDDSELSKILVIFAQSLTIHSEYNFNAALKLSHNLVTEVYLVNENRYVSLVDLYPDMYLKAINEAKNIGSAKNQSKPMLALKKIEYESFFHGGKNEDVNLFFGGIRILHTARFIFKLESDFRNVSHHNFTSNGYYETRTENFDNFESRLEFLNLSDSNLDELPIQENSLEFSNVDESFDLPELEDASEVDNLPTLEEDSDPDDLPPLEEDLFAKKKGAHLEL